MAIYPDQIILRLARLDTRLVPVRMLARALRLTDGELRAALREEIARRAPRGEGERRELVSLALSHGVGGVALIDHLGGYERHRPIQ